MVFVRNLVSEVGIWKDCPLLVSRIHSHCVSLVAPSSYLICSFAPHFRLRLRFSLLLASHPPENVTMHVMSITTILCLPPDAVLYMNQSSVKLCLSMLTYHEPVQKSMTPVRSDNIRTSCPKRTTGEVDFCQHASHVYLGCWYGHGGTADLRQIRHLQELSLV